MYAVVRTNTYDPAALAGAAGRMSEFQSVHAAQPGYRGTIVIDAGAGRQVVVNLWDSEPAARAALPAMIPHLQRLLEPLMTAPAQLVGAGPIVMTDVGPPPPA